jgi:NAD(P)-dependent dehydrogenase (short-subunit alcohol dehydrogenase family)
VNLSRERACDGKKPHRTRAAATVAMRRKTARGAKRLNVYPCPHARHWHVGHLPYPEETPAVTAYDDLSDEARKLIHSFSELDIAEIAADASRAAAEAAAARDGAYRERAHLVAFLAAIYPAVIAPAADVDEPGWQLVYIDASGWQLSWHIAPADAELFQHVPRVPADHSVAQWDGHTTEQKYDRIRRVIAMITEG